MDDYRYKSLQTLTRARFDVVQNLTREKQHFANYLFLKCSGMAQDKDIANSSATTIALMERFETADELAYADLDELTRFISETGRNFADPAAKAKAIQAAAKNSYRLPTIGIFPCSALFLSTHLSAPAFLRMAAISVVYDSVCAGCGIRRGLRLRRTTHHILRHHSSLWGVSCCDFLVALPDLMGCGPFGGSGVRPAVRPESSPWRGIPCQPPPDCGDLRLGAERCPAS